MQSNIGKPDSGRRRSVTKQVGKVHSRNVPYRVGYSWNKGGRLKELRIRHLARKFLKIWIQNTFGRILPHKAKSHYKSMILRRTFEGWRDEWWTSSREWSLTLRADCHYRYYLCYLAFHKWRTFLLLQREKKSKIHQAQTFADRHKMCLVWERWEVFTQMKRMKNRMAESALKLKRFSILHSVWSMWRAKLQHHQDICALEDQVLKKRALALQRRAWLRWKEMYTSACRQEEKESEAVLKRKAFNSWKIYTSHLQAKKKLQSDAQHLNRLQMVMKYWNKWSCTLNHKRIEEDHLQAAGLLAIQMTQRRALEHGKAYVALCRQEDERTGIASQHYNLHLLRAGLRGLSLNITWNKRHRMNNHIAVQHYFHTVRNKYWKLWQNGLEEAEDERFQPLREMALTKHRMSLLSSFFQDWREKLAEQRHSQELERRADVRFADRVLPQCLDSWIEFTMQRRLSRQRRRKAELYDQQRQYTWAFYTWWEQLEKHNNQRLSEQMAILQEERRLLQRAWGCWGQWTEQQINETDNSTEIPDRYILAAWRENAALLTEVMLMEEKAHHHFNYSLQLKMFLAWRKATADAVSTHHQQRAAALMARSSINQVRLLQSFKQWRRDTREAQGERTGMEKATWHHESKLLSTALNAWNQYHNQHHRNKVMKRQGLLLLKLKMYQTYFEQWKVKLQHRRRDAEQTGQALWHWSLTLQAKVLYGWRLWVTEQRRKREQAAQAALIYRDRLLREGVTCILTYAAHMNDLTASLAQNSQEQRSQHLQRAVRRCAMQWKQRVLCKSPREQEVKGQQPKKNVTFCLKTLASRSTSQSDSVEQEAEDEGQRMLIHKPLAVTCTQENPKQQPGCHTALPCSHPDAFFTSSHHDSVISTKSPSKCHTSAMNLPPETHVLLPPSAFMTTSTKDPGGKTSTSGFRDDPLVPPMKQPSAFLDAPQKASSREPGVTDPSSALIKELLSIQLDMKTYQQGRKQLRAWQKLKAVLQSWLQTSGQDEQKEKNAVYEELKELEERIDRLSAEVAERKPTMLLHAARIKDLQTVLTDGSLFTT